MKPGPIHYVPLSRQAVELLRNWKSLCDPKQDLLFPNRRDPKRPMAGRSLNNVMDKLGYLDEGVPHGMRSCFSTYANRRFKHHADAVERCLAHVEKDKVRGAYNRYEYKSERKKLMQAWANHLDHLTQESEARGRGVTPNCTTTVKDPSERIEPSPSQLKPTRSAVRSPTAPANRLSGFRNARAMRHQTQSDRERQDSRAKEG